MTRKGGVKRLAFATSSLPAMSFPLFHANFQTLESLSITNSRRIWKNFSVGSFRSLPPSLTFLELNFWTCSTGWLQPSAWTGNNDDVEWTKSGVPYKPIYMDQLLPKLRVLKLIAGNDVAFAPYGHPGQAFQSKFSYQHALDIMSQPKLQMDINWTNEMRTAWLSHFPHSLESATFSALTTTQIDIMKLVPPGLVELHFLSDSSSSKLSSLPASLNDSLQSLELRGQLSLNTLDAPFPKSLLKLSFLDCWHSTTLIPNMLALLPSTLTKLFIACPLNANTLACFPSKLIELRVRLIETPQPADIGCLPACLEVFHLSGEIHFSEDHAAPLPRGLKEFVLDDSSAAHVISSITAPAFFSNLPASLRRVELGQCSANMTDDILPLLPPNLTALKLTKARWPAAALTQLPPQLTLLELNDTSIPDTIIPFISSHLKVTINSIIATGSLLKLSETKLNRETLLHSVKEVSPTFCGNYGRDLSYHISTSHLTHIPEHVTSIDSTAYDVNLGQISHNVKLDNYHPQVEHIHLIPPSYPNIMSVKLDQVTTLRLSFIVSLPNLRSLDLPRCYRLYDDLAVRNATQQIPQSLTRCNTPMLDSTAIFPDTQPIPPGLSFLVVSLYHDGFAKRIHELNGLETFQCNLGYSSRSPPQMPPSVTSLTFTGSLKSDLDLEKLPPSLKTLAGPLSFKDSDLQRLPQSLTDLSVTSLEWLEENTHLYARSHDEDFVVPKSLTDIARDLRFSTTNNPWASFAPDSSQSPSAIETSPASAATPPPKKEDWLRMIKVSNLENPIRTDLLRVLSPDLRSLAFTQDASADILLSLPTTLQALDALSLKSITEVHLENLPPTLTSLSIQGAELSADIVATLPRNLTYLAFTKLLGRINEARAQLLPPNLLTLRLGSCLIGNDAIRHLPRTLTEIAAPNSALLTDAGAPHFPPGLLKLSIPTCRLSYEAAIQLPRTLTSLHYGTGCTVPSTAILEYFKHNHEAQTPPDATV